MSLTDEPSVILFTPESLNLSATPYIVNPSHGQKIASFAHSEHSTIASDHTAISSALETSSHTSDVSTPATSIIEAAAPATKRPSLSIPPYQGVHFEKITLEDALLWRPTHVFAHTPPMKKFCNETIYDADVVYGSLTSHACIVRGSHPPPRNAQVSQNLLVSPAQRDLAPRVPCVDERKENLSPQSPGKTKNHRWRALRRTVSHILHRNTDIKGAYAPSPLSSSFNSSGTSTTSARTLKTPQSAYLKTSSTFLFSKHSRHSVAKSRATPLAPHLFDEPQSQTTAHEQKLRRSRSFSGYPNILSTIADECRTPVPVVYQHGGMYEDADWLMGEIKESWAFAPLNMDDPAVVAQDLEARMFWPGSGF
ncbi:hypothetical protein DXG01_016806 [Tephrocybe rancida]|nr:hypothetical protein DXG01_016806 [Tephrocybe rancida]